jgi:hypothetical protein
MTRRLLLLTVVALAAAFGATAARADVSWTPHVVADAGFALNAPRTWLDVTAPLKPQLLDRDAAKSPALAALVKWAAGNELVRLLCADPSGSPSVSVTVGGHVGASLTLRTLVADNVAVLRHLSFISAPLTVSSLRLPAGAAMLVRYRETASSGTGVTHSQYYLVHAGRAFIVDFTTSAASDSQTQALVSESARSFRFTS